MIPSPTVALFVATFTVDGIPQPKGSMKMLPRGRRSDGSVKWVLGSDNDALEAWEQAIIWTARSHRPRTPLTGPVAMVVEFRFPVLKNAPKRRQLPMTSKPDLSKLLRGIEDGLSGMFYVDDAQITDCHVKKRRAYDGAPGVTITVSETDGLS